MFFVYILYSLKLNRYYIGTTDNVEERLIEHNSQKHESAYTARGIPWRLMLVLENLNSKQAYAIEKHIKSMKSKVYIQNLIQYSEMRDELKTRFE